MDDNQHDQPPGYGQARPNRTHKHTCIHKQTLSVLQLFCPLIHNDIPAIKQQQQQWYGSHQTDIPAGVTIAAATTTIQLMNTKKKYIVTGKFRRMYWYTNNFPPVIWLDDWINDCFWLFVWSVGWLDGWLADWIYGLTGSKYIAYTRPYMS